MRTFKGFSSIGQTWGKLKLYDLDLAKRDLLNELYTRKGERLMAPQFGCIVWDVLFDPLTDELVNAVKDDVRRIITKDPRLELRQMDVTEDDHSITLSIVLNYVPTATVTELVAVYNRDVANNKLQG